MKKKCIKKVSIIFRISLVLFLFVLMSLYTITAYGSVTVECDIGGIKYTVYQEAGGEYKKTETTNTGSVTTSARTLPPDCKKRLEAAQNRKLKSKQEKPDKQDGRDLGKISWEECKKKCTSNGETATQTPDKRCICADKKLNKGLQEASKREVAGRICKKLSAACSRLNGSLSTTEEIGKGQLDPGKCICRCKSQGDEVFTDKNLKEMNQYNPGYCALQAKTAEVREEEEGGPGENVLLLWNNNGKYKKPVFGGTGGCHYIDEDGQCQENWDPLEPNKGGKPQAMYMGGPVYRSCQKITSFNLQFLVSQAAGKDCKEIAGAFGWAIKKLMDKITKDIPSRWVTKDTNFEGEAKRLSKYTKKIKNLHRKIIKCTGLVTMLGDGDWEQNEATSKSSMDGKFECKTQGSETQDWPSCTRAITATTITDIGKKALVTYQAVDYEGFSHDLNMKLQKSKDIQTDGLRAQASSLNKKADAARQQAAADGIKTVAAAAVAGSWVTWGDIIGKCQAQCTGDFTEHIRKTIIDYLSKFKYDPQRDHYLAGAQGGEAAGGGGGGGGSGSGSGSGGGKKEDGDKNQQITGIPHANPNYPNLGTIKYKGTTYQRSRNSQGEITYVKINDDRTWETLNNNDVPEEVRNYKFESKKKKEKERKIQLDDHEINPDEPIKIPTPMKIPEYRTIKNIIPNLLIRPAYANPAAGGRGRKQIQESEVFGDEPAAESPCLQLQGSPPPMVNLILNSKALEAVKGIMLESAIGAAINLAKAYILDKQARMIRRAMKGIKTFDPPDFQWAAAGEDAIVTLCEAEPSHPACRPPEERASRGFADSSIIFSGGSGEAVSQGLTDGQRRAGDTSKKSEKEKGTKKSIGGIDAIGGGPGKGSGFAGAIPGAAREKAGGGSPGGGGGGGVGGGGGGGGGGGAPRGDPGKRPYVSRAFKGQYGAGGGTLYKGGGRKRGKKKKSKNPFSSMFKKGRKVASTLKFGKKQIAPKGTNLFQIISKRYDAVEKSNRLEKYKFKKKK